ncbi:MAG: hypothetical protein ABI324_28440 [Ktedonobacteraceae bacterium]
MKTLTLAMEDAVLLATEQPGSWKLETTLADVPAHALAADLYNPARLYCATFGKGLWRSNDAGKTWEPVGSGIGSAEVMAVAVSPVERVGIYGVVWAGTEPSALFRSEDGGDTWVERTSLQDVPSRTALPWSFPPRPHTHHVRWIEPDPVDPARLFVAIEQGGVMVSRDYGVTWEDHKIEAQIDGHSLASHKRAPGRVYETGGSGTPAHSKHIDEQGRPYLVLTYGGYAETHDGGMTWETQTEGLEHFYFWSVAVDPADPETILLSGARGPQHAHFADWAESCIYKRTGNSPWRLVSAGLPESKGTIIQFLTTREEEPGTFYAASGRGVYRSTDQGEHWERLPIDLPEHFRMQHAHGLVIGEV